MTADTDTARALEVLGRITPGRWYTGGINGLCQTTVRAELGARIALIDDQLGASGDYNARAIAVTPQLVALFAAAAELEKARNTPVELDIHDTETGEPDHPDDKPTHSSDWAHHDWHERVRAAEQKLWAAIAAVTKGVLGHE